MPLPRFCFPRSIMAALRHPLLILVLLGGLAFAAVPFFELVWDDLHFLHPGSVLATGSWARLLTSDWSLEGPRSGYYRPVVTLTLAAETRIFGGSPAAYHVMNVVYHLAASLALVWAALRVLGSRPAWLAGFVFVVHPIHTESVSWISGRTDVIATIFFCLALGCYARAEGLRSRWMLGAMVAAAAAFLSKEPAIVLPAVLVGWEMTRRHPERRPAREMVLRLLPIVMVAIGTLAIRHLVLGSVAGALAEGPPLSDRLATGVATIGRYLVLLAAPYPPTPDFVLEPLATWDAWATVASLAAIAGLAAACTLAWRRSRIPAFLLAWFLLTLLPSTPLMPVGPVHMAERFLYLPSAAFALALGWVAAHALERAGFRGWDDLAPAHAMRASLAASGVALLLVGGLALTLYRNEDWRDAERLFTRMAESSPRSWKAANGLGHVYEDRGQLAVAAMEYRRAMALRPGAVAPLISLALVESRMGLHEVAKRRAEDAQRLDPEGGVTLQVAWIHSNAGEHDAAAAALAMAAAREPWRPETRFYQALALARAGRAPEARTVLSDAERQVAGLDPRGVSWRPIADQARAAVRAEAKP
jgi:protein O-mannosyl-transferase